MSATLKLPNQLAGELAWINAPCTSFVHDWQDPKTYGVTEVVENRHTGEQTRWSSVHELVIRTKDGALWMTSYTQGLTESQDERPFEYDGDEIEFTQVNPVPVSHIEYQPVGN
jgi:hypothetical protein